MFSPPQLMAYAKSYAWKHEVKHGNWKSLALAHCSGWHQGFSLCRMHSSQLSVPPVELSYNHLPFGELSSYSGLNCSAVVALNSA
jgi:hypothetical protein